MSDYSQEFISCICCESSINEEIVFLIDCTDKDSFADYFSTHWAEMYTPDVIRYQQKVNGNVNFHFVIFGSKVMYYWNYSMESTPSWYAIDSQESEISEESNQVDFCVGYEKAKYIFDNSIKRSNTIIYMLQ